MADSVRRFVIESLKGFYERLPLKKVAVDGSVLTPDASGVVNVPAGGGMTYITYAELKNLRDTSSLVPGMQYRIIDYHCSTTQEDTSTADNQFDIIVTADSSTVLNENARAAKHTDSSTDYFVKCNLEAWELKYSLDNDKERFVWAKELKSPISHQDIINILYQNTGNPDVIYLYVRYPSLDSNNQYAWVYSLGNPGVEGVNLTIEEWINLTKTANAENLDTYDIVYTQTPYPSIGDIASLDGDPVTVVETSWGQGVVYYMKDEWNNECPYDFKNIMFRRWEITSCPNCPSLVVNNEDNHYGFYYGAKWNGNNVIQSSDASYGSANGYFYTFALKDLENGDWFDYTVVANLGLKNDEGVEMTCHNNHIGNFTDEYISGNGYIAKMLNNIVFFNVYTDLSDTSYADSYSYCYFNTFGNDCHSNTFGNSCDSNSFGNRCHSNFFGYGCSSNSFGNRCHSNFFRTGCDSNSFGNRCHSNFFGYGCSSNSFGHDCYSNSFGNDCDSNSFENECCSNSFGNGCLYNSFGNNCFSNFFGNSCSHNSFGDTCGYIKFGNFSFTKSYYQYIIVENGNRSIHLNTTLSTSSANKIWNIKIAQGVNNTSTLKTITHNTANDTFQTVYQPANSRTISV